jgi:hypothetical protein
MPTVARFAPIDLRFSPVCSLEIAVRRRSFLAELFDYVLANKAWMLAPIILVLLLAGVLIILGGTQAAPLIYTLF